MKQTDGALVLLGLLALARPVLSQTANTADLGALLQGDKTPLTHKLSDLDTTWRRLSLGASADAGNPASAYLSLFVGLGSGSDVYYTQGRMVSVAGETYLVAYRRRAKPLDVTALMRPNGQNDMPKPDPLTPDTVLSLSLLNLRVAGSLNDIRAFDIQQEMLAVQQTAISADAASTQHNSLSSVSNLKQVSLGLLQYVQDYDENLPPMKDAATVKKAIYPYVKSDQIFIQPDTKRPYKPNSSLSGRSLATFSAPATMVTFYEDAADQDNTRAVAFLDGHVVRIPEAQWPSLKRASHVPGP